LPHFNTQDPVSSPLLYRKTRNEKEEGEKSNSNLVGLLALDVNQLPAVPSSPFSYQPFVGLFIADRLTRCRLLQLVVG
jgi:hypothetical protein